MKRKTLEMFNQMLPNQMSRILGGVRCTDTCVTQTGDGAINGNPYSSDSITIVSDCSTGEMISWGRKYVYC